MDYACQCRISPHTVAALVGSHSPTEDQTCYSDVGATHHITYDLANLSVCSDYQGGNTVHVGNGQGSSITHTGSSTLHTPNSSFHLHNILRSPTAATNLLSIKKSSKDNDRFFYFDSNGVIAKDKISGRTLFRRQTENGLYPFRLSRNHINKAQLLFLANKSHLLLGIQDSVILHPPFCLTFSLDLIYCTWRSPPLPPFVLIFNLERVRSYHILLLVHSPPTRPLELIHCDVWGPAPVSSISGFKPGADSPYDDLGWLPQINLAIPRALHGPWNHAPYMCKGRPTCPNSPVHTTMHTAFCNALVPFSSHL